MGILSGIFKSRDKPQNATSGSAYRFFIGGSSSGKNVNERSAMQMTAVYSCVRILSEAVASLPLHVYKYNGDGGKEKAVKHPLYFLLHGEPNPEMTSFVFRETLMTHLLLWGNAYAQIIRNGKGEIIALYPLMPNRMTVDRDDKGQLYYQYNTSKDDAPTMKGSMVNLKPSDVLHIPGLGFDGLVGYSPIAMAKNAIGMAIACEEYGAKFFANGATPGGILEHPGTVKDPQRERRANRMKKFWKWKNQKVLNQETQMETVERTLFLNGTIAEDSWFDDDVTPQMFKEELMDGNGNITVWINSPGGDCVAAAQIYNMLREYEGKVTVKIDGIAASAASVIAMAGDTVLMSPVSMMMIHNVRPDRALLIAG